jgi:phosphatidylglycerol:prolipoprotein diacylglycerol transferase
VHPIAFHIGNVAIHWYGILVAVGFLAGFWTASRRAPLDGLSSESVADIGPWLIVGGLVGARMLYVITYWQEDFAGAPLTDIFKIRQGGLVFTGASLALPYVALFTSERIQDPNLEDGRCIGSQHCSRDMRLEGSDA